MSAQTCELEILEMLESWSGERLKEIRELAGYRTQEDLGMKLRKVWHARTHDKDWKSKFKQNTISRWESGDQIPGADDLYLIAYCLGVVCNQLGLPVGTDIQFKDGRLITPRSPDLIPDDEPKRQRGRPRKSSDD